MALLTYKVGDEFYDVPVDKETEFKKDFPDAVEEIKNPAVVMMQRTEQGMGVALMPYLPYCDGNISFHKNGIIAEGEPSQNMRNEYNRIFGSGIEIVPASALHVVK